MRNLKPDTRYYYQVGDGSDNWSKVFSFKTFHPDIGTSDVHPLRIGSVGDMGYANNSDNTINRLSELIDNGELDMVIHNGDISYADGEFGIGKLNVRRRMGYWVPSLCLSSTNTLK